MIDLEKFPIESGVYLMKDSSGAVLYIGKAKQLRTRLKHYFAKRGDDRAMIPFLISQIAQIDTIVTPSEKEALLLENTLIKRHQPKYNALLKDDKTFISLMINHRHPWPRLKLVRYKGKPKEEGLYFGPYPEGSSARHTFDLLTRLFPLRQCSDEELKRRKRPCLLYAIGRCIAPCVGKCSREQYQTFVHGAIEFLKGRDTQILAELKREMEKAAEELEFEKAASLRNTIQQIEHVVKSHSLVAQAKGNDSDAFGIYREGSQVVVFQLIIRNGQLIGAEPYPFSGVAQEDADLLESFLVQHYKRANQIPSEILIPLPLPSSASISELLTEICNHKVEIHCPRKGDKREFILLAEKNGQVFYTKEKDQEALCEKVLFDLEQLLHLSRYPERIECFDTSNISGTDLVASMVAFTKGNYDKQRTRLFKIKNIHKGDDYGALHQVLSRRLLRAKEEEDLPDLIVIDGGKGQLNVALDLFQELDIASVDLISIAKEEGRHDKGLTQEKIFLPHHKEALLLPLRSDALLFLQRVRDAAHEKAIRFHRKRRQKRILASALDEIPGIGPVKRQALLRRFGSWQKVRSASAEELSQIEKLTKKDIKAILSKQ